VRKLLAVVGALLIAGLLSPTAARAAERVTVTVNGTLTMWDRWECVSPTSDPSCAQNGGGTPEARPLRLYAPVSPSCVAGTLLCPDDTIYWRFGAADNPNAPVPCLVGHGSSGSSPCRVYGFGTFSNSSPTGPMCGFTQGSLVVNVKVGSVEEEVGGSGNLHAGPVIGAWPLSQEQPPFGGKGAAVLTASSVPTCGLNPLDGFAGTHKMNVAITFTWTNQV